MVTANILYNTAKWWQFYIIISHMIIQILLLYGISYKIVALFKMSLVIFPLFQLCLVFDFYINMYILLLTIILY